MSSPEPVAADRLLALLLRYEAAMNSWLVSPLARPSTLEADLAFAALRLQQRVRWPQGAALVDEIGVRAQDVLLARQAHGTDAAPSRAAVAAHHRALVRAAAALQSAGIAEVAA